LAAQANPRSATHTIPAQVPRTEVVFDGADDALVAFVAGKDPAAHRDAVAGDRHRDDYLRQVVAVVFGLAERAGGPFGRYADTVVDQTIVEVGELVGDFDVPIGGGGIHEDDRNIKVERWATEAKISGGDLVRCAEQEIHCRVGGVLAELGPTVDSDPLPDPAGGGQFTALDVASGSVIAEHHRRHRHQEFLRFLQTIDKAVPAGVGPAPDLQVKNGGCATLGSICTSRPPAAPGLTSSNAGSPN
jgi:hypothetical protein